MSGRGGGLARNGCSRALGEDGRRELALLVPPLARIPVGLDVPAGGSPNESPAEGPVRHASTARPLQEKSIPRPRRLPAASGLVQARVGPDVGGDRPSNRGRSRHRQAVVEEGSASQLSASESAPRPGRKRGTRPPVRRLRGRGAGQPPGRPVPGHRPAETQKGPHTSVSGGGGRTPGDPLPRISAVSVPRRPARPLEQPQRLLLGLG